MISGDAGFLVAVVVIFAIAAAVAAYAIKRLNNHPVRIAAVIVALAGLLGAMPRIAHELSQPQQSVQAPAAPQAGPKSGDLR